MDPNKVIDAIGGTGATAGLCGVTPSAVSQWRKGGIPRPWEKFLREARPEAFVSSDPSPSATESQKVA